MSVENNFDLVTRPHNQDCVWKHKTKPVWIVFYSAVEGIRLSYWQAYRAICDIPQGREPWTVDNRRIGNANHGFQTLLAAMEAADA